MLTGFAGATLHKIMEIGGDGWAIFMRMKHRFLAMRFGCRTWHAVNSLYGGDLPERYGVQSK
jgi:hypothetical protein